MKLTAWILFVCLLFPRYTKGQPPHIQKKIFLNNVYTADSRDVIETTPGNYIVLGTSYDSVGGQVVPKLTLAGLDQNGNLAWRKGYGNSKFHYTPYIWSAGIAIKKNSSLLSALFVADSNQKQCGVLIKFRFNGDTLWQKKFYISGSQVFFTSVAPSCDNGLLITGAVQTNSPGFNNHPIVGTYVLKTDSNGQKLWDKIIYKANLDETNAGYKIIQDPVSKRLFIAGNQDIGSSSCSQLMILDSLGNFISRKNFTGLGGALIDIIRTADGKFAACGGNVNAQQINNIYASRSLLVKFDADGSLIYQKEYDSLSVNNNFNNLLELPGGDLIISGVYQALFQYNLGLNELLRIARVDANGNLKWKKYFDFFTDNTNQEVSQGMNLASGGGIILTGDSPGGETPPLPYLFLRSDTSYCDPNAISCASYVGLEEKFIAGNVFFIYPNPSQGTCNVQLNGNFFGPVSLQIFDVDGRNILRKELQAGERIFLDLRHLSPGVYSLLLNCEEQRSIKKLIIDPR